MYLQNKYTQCYYNIVNRAKSRVLNGYSEIHHVLPKSLGGTDDPNNLVKLTAREHYICHLLLPKMTSGVSYQKMVYAYTIMSGRRLYNSKKYNFYRTEYAKINSELRSGEGNGMFGANRKGEKNTFFGRKHSDETKRKISEKKKGVSISLPPMSESHKRNISKAAIGKGEKITFIHKDHGIFVGTNYDLIRAFPNIFDKSWHGSEVWKLSAGYYKSCKGWQVVNQDQVLFVC